MRFRLFDPSNLAACARLVHPGFAPGSPPRAKLPLIWSELLAAQQLLGGLIVDGDSASASEPVAFGVAVFVTDEFVDEALSAPKPYLAERLYQRVAAKRSPVLTLDQVRTANSGPGLNLLILHYGQIVWDLSDSRSRAILSAGHIGWRLAFDGYRLRRILEEVFGDQLEAKRAAGLRVKSQYPSFAWSGSPADRPFLMGLFCDDPESRLPGSSAASIFQYRAPRFAFSVAEQRVLTAAVFEEADDARIALHSKISSGAVQQVWRRIYQRVADVDPAVLGEVDLEETPRATRGREKRRHLIEYLRFHPEELRPTLRAPRTSHGRAGPNCCPRRSSCGILRR